MNLLTFAAVTGVALGALYPVVRYFIPPREAGLSGGALTLDELGNPMRPAADWPVTRKATAAWCRVSRVIPPI
jgi:cytochrome b6-f complex iron-sulfur subunit